MALTIIPQLIIFDCDGVVADSEALANHLLAETITRMGIPTTMEPLCGDLSTHAGSSPTIEDSERVGDASGRGPVR